MVMIVIIIIIVNTVRSINVWWQLWCDNNNIDTVNFLLSAVTSTVGGQSIFNHNHYIGHFIYLVNCGGCGIAILQSVHYQDPNLVDWKFGILKV